MLHNPKIELTMFTRMRMAKDAALGMYWLHASHPQFIHRDLKSSNLLVDENGRVKVCDFGLSQIKPQGENIKDTDSAKGTVRDRVCVLSTFSSNSRKLGAGIRPVCLCMVVLFFWQRLTFHAFVSAGDLQPPFFSTRPRRSFNAFKRPIPLADLLSADATTLLLLDFSPSGWPPR